MHVLGLALTLTLIQSHKYESGLVLLDFLLCDPGAGSPVIVFVSKLFAVDSSALPQNRSRCVCVMGDDVIPFAMHSKAIEMVM